MRSGLLILGLLSACHSTSSATRGDAGDADASVLPTDDAAVSTDLRGADLNEPATDGDVTVDQGASDAATIPSRPVCGATSCRVDQTCSAGACVFACTGLQVPGDYATIQGAINANLGSDTTICLQAKSYTELLAVTQTPATPKHLTLIGVSSSATSVEGLTLSAPAFDQVSIRGLSFTNGVVIEDSPEPIELVGDKLMGVGNSVALGTDGNSDITVDGCEITGGTDRSGISVVGPYGDEARAVSPKLLVQNSWFYGLLSGVAINANGSFVNTMPGATVMLINDTFYANTTAIVTTGADLPVYLTLANDLILDSTKVGIDLECTTSSVTTKDNLLFGNTNNYAGTAVDGAGYVKADPKLDTTQSPPALLPGSPARGVADPTLAPATDYWGVARGTAPDIGAVQN